MTTFIETLTRHCRTLGRFPRLRDRAFYVYGRILRRISWPLPGRRTAIQVQLLGQPAPFHLRLGSTDWLVLEEIFQKDEYTFVREEVKEACWIVDLGANVGYSLRYWQNLFPKARMVAMEPEPGNCLICLRNLCTAGLQSQVKLLQAGVGARRDHMRLVDFGDGEWAYRTIGNENTDERSVEVLPLAEVLETHAKGQRIDLLKCDIEGAERELFEDCGAWIGRVEAIVIELHPTYGLPALMQALNRAGADFQVAVHMQQKTCPVVLLRRATGASRKASL